MGAFSVFPLMAVPVVIYNIMAFSGQALNGLEAMRARLDTDFLTLPMASGVTWSITPGHALIALSLCMLFFEIVRSTRTGQVALMNHALSLVLVIVTLIQFLLMPAFATSVFCLIALMTLLDVMAGMIIGVNSARRDVAFDGASAS